MDASQRLLPISAKVLLGLVLPTFVSGCCSGIGYTIEMEITDASFSRSVAVVSGQEASPEDGKPSDPTLPESLRAPFVAIYGPGERIEQGEKFSGSFSEATPNDVGGPGTLLRVTSELGTAFYYHERFGGTFPTLQARELREQAVDGFVDWLTDWLRRDLDPDEHATRVIDFVDGPLRTDAQDLVCLFDGLAIATGDVGSDKGYPAGLMQIGHFLVERGYLTPKKLALLNLSNFSEDEKNRLSIEALRARISDAAEVAPDAPPMKRLFDDPDSTWERFGDYLRTTPEFQQFIERQATSGKQGEVKPDDLIGEQVSPLMLTFFGRAFSCRQNLDVTLRTSAEPYTTNGVWDDEAKAVRWSDRNITGKPDAPVPKSDPKSAELTPGIDASVTGLPVILVAGWAVPDEQRQAEWFGETKFAAEELARYCTWRDRLSDDAAARWQACVDEMRHLPVAERDEQLREFLSALPDPSAEEALLKTLAASLLFDQ